MAQIIGKTGNYGYRVYYRDSNGKRHSINKKGFKRKSDAVAAANEIDVRKYQFGISDNENVSFADYYNQWINTYKLGHLDKSTESRYRTNAKYIEDYFGITPLKKVSKMDYQRFLNEYGKSHVIHTVRRLNGTIRDCIQDALEDRIIYRDFTRKVVINGLSSNSSELKYLQVDEAQKLISYCLDNLSLKYMSLYEILFGVLTGCRYGEVTGLTWDCVDFKNNTVSIEKAYDYINRTGFKKTKTKSSIRTISIDNVLSEKLKQLKREQNENFLRTGFRNTNNLVFLSNRHVIITDTAVNKKLKDICENIIHSKNTITFHGLRHTHASILISQGISLEYVSSRLGHSNTSVTARVYIHMLKEFKEMQENKTKNVLDNIVKNAE